MTAAKTGKKQGGKPFEPGQSGNPAGRPEGSRNRATLLLEKLVHDEAEEVSRRIIDAAKGGDMQAAKMIWDRVYPVPKGRKIPLTLPAIESASDVMKAIGATIGAMSRGAISPDEAGVIAGVLESKRRAIETVEIERRLAALEGKQQ